MHFGLGKSSIADSIEVEWPSGGREMLKGVTSRQLKVILVPHQVDSINGAAGTERKQPRFRSRRGLWRNSGQPAKSRPFRSLAEAVFCTLSGQQRGTPLSIAEGYTSRLPWPDAPTIAAITRLMVAAGL